MRTLVCLTVFVAAFCTLLGGVEATEKGLVGYWSFNAGKGDAAEDSSGMNNNGELIGNIDWVDGKFGNALKFSESQSCVKIEHSESIDLAKEFTIALWLNPEESQNDWAKVICKQKTDTYPYSLQYDDANRIKGVIAAPSTPKMDSSTGWWHMALVYDGTALILYKDGVEDVRQAASGELMHNDLTLTIGSALNSGQSFKGVIDEVRLYNIALSQQQLKRVMESEGIMAVSPSGKLTVTWGVIKGQ